MIKNKETLLKFFIAGFTILLLGLVGYSFLHGKYFFAEEDEGIYYNAARTFAETSSARAADCNDESVSRIGQFDWYGPMYHIFYGSVAKIAGEHTYNFLVVNLICLAVIVLLVWRADFAKQTKLLITCAFLSAYPMIFYIFTLYPETLELLFAVILTLQLYRLHKNYSVIGLKKLMYLSTFC